MNPTAPGRRAWAVWIGAAMALASAATIMGWHLGAVALVQPIRGAPPMQHNTALGFLLVSLALAALGLGRPSAARLLGAAVTCLGLVTLAQYALGEDLGLDRLFIDPHRAIPYPHPGRMAANSALCFALLGPYVAVLGTPAVPRQVAAVARTGLVIVMVLAAVAALAHAVGLTAGQGWLVFQMAPQSTALFLASSGALLAASPRLELEAVRSGPPGGTWLPWAVSAATLLASILVWLGLTAHEDRLVRERLAADARLVRQVVEAGLSESANAISRMARRWELSGQRTREQFELEAEVNRQSYPSLRAIGWVGPDLVVRWVHPLRGNEAALGLDVNAEPRRAAAYLRARVTARLALSPPIDLIQGGRGMLAVDAIQINGGDAGFIYAAIDPDVLLGRSLGGVAAGRSLLVEAEGTLVYRRDGASLGPLTVERFTFGGVKWTASVWAGTAAPIIPLADATLALSAVLSLMLGLALRGRITAAQQAHRATAAERSSADAARFLQAVIDGAMDPIFVKDPGGHYLLANRRTAEVLGAAPEAIRARRDADFLPPGAAREIAEAEQRVIRDRRTLVLEETIPDREEARVFLTARTPLFDADGRCVGVIGIARDITDRKRVEADVRRLNAELEHKVEERTRRLAEANAELEGFAHSVAHDLRAPLRSMRGFGQALLEDYGEALDATARDYLGRIAGSAERMDQLIQDLLAYARIAREDLRLVPLDLRRVVDEALGQLEGSLREAEVSVEEPLPWVMGHPAVLGQVMANLLSNAAKFVVPSRKPQIRVWAECQADGPVRLWVEDNGIGIAPEHQGRIFVVFHRLHGMAAYPGTGIGLAVVRRGTERMGGAAGVVSEPGKGSRFWVELEGTEQS